MSAPVPLRPDFDAALLRRLARQPRAPDETRRLLALAEIYDGGPRSNAARISGVGLDYARLGASVHHRGFGGSGPGAFSILDHNQRRALRQVVEDGPIPAVHGVVRWRLIDWHNGLSTRSESQFPGVGFLTAMTIAAAVTDLSQSGREFAAWLGLEPRLIHWAERTAMAACRRRAEGTAFYALSLSEPHR